MNEDDPDRRAQFCEWFQHKVHKDEEFVSKTVWSNEVTFKLDGTVNRHKCVTPDSPHIHVEDAVNLPGLTAWCGLSYRGSFFEGTITGRVYLNIHFICHPLPL
jgi:hypothetical protein